jgi:hypothetical protein
VGESLDHQRDDEQDPLEVGGRMPLLRSRRDREPERASEPVLEGVRSTFGPELAGWERSDSTDDPSISTFLGPRRVCIGTLHGRGLSERTEAVNKIAVVT